MRTTVTIPDDVFELADEEARRQGLTRSQFYAEAVRRLVRTQKRENITERFNKVYSRESSEVDPVMMELQMRTVEPEEW